MNTTVIIEFGLPNGSAGQAAAHSSGHLRRRLAEWAEQYNIQLELSTQHHDYRYWLRVKFTQQRDFTVFALSWQGDSFMPWQTVDSESE